MSGRVALAASADGTVAHRTDPDSATLRQWIHDAFDDVEPHPPPNVVATILDAFEIGLMTGPLHDQAGLSRRCLYDALHDVNAPPNIIAAILDTFERGFARQLSRPQSGTACRWDDQGFGFIKPDDGGVDLFCHVSSITDGSCLQDGARVQFVKVYDEEKAKERAEQVTGGSSQDAGDATASTRLREHDNDGPSSVKRQMMTPAGDWAVELPDGDVTVEPPLAAPSSGNATAEPPAVPSDPDPALPAHDPSVTRQATGVDYMPSTP